MDLGQKLLMLEEDDLWFKVVVPENISAWIEVRNVVNTEESDSELALIWQKQRIQRRTGASSSDVSKSSIKKQSSEESSLTSSLEMVEESEQVDNSEIESLTVDEFVGKLDAKVEILTELSINTDAVDDMATEEPAVVADSEDNSEVIELNNQEPAQSAETVFAEDQLPHTDTRDWIAATLWCLLGACRQGHFATLTR